MEWIKKRVARVANNSGSDVTLSVTRYIGRDEHVVIKFRNHSYAKITKTNSMVLGISGTRLYFREALTTEGFTLTSFNKIKSTAHFKVSMSQLKLSSTKIELGDYNLQYDTSQKLYYIDVTNKLKP